MARFLGVFFLVFLLLRSFGLHAVHYPERHLSRPIVPEYFFDTRTPFKEKSFWLDYDAEGNLLVCSKPLFIQPFSYLEPPIRCERVRKVTLLPHKQLRNRMKQTCYYANDFFFCLTVLDDIRDQQPAKLVKSNVAPANAFGTVTDEEGELCYVCSVS